MAYDIHLAKKICKQMGIPWDETATSITIGGVTIDENFDIRTLFYDPDQIRRRNKYLAKIDAMGWKEKDGVAYIEIPDMEFCKRNDCWYNNNGQCSCCDDYRNNQNPKACDSYIEDDEN